MNEAGNILNVNAIAPKCLEAHFWCRVDIWLHILGMLDICRYSRARIVQKRPRNAFARWVAEFSRGINSALIHFFTRRWVFLLGLEEFT